MSLGTLRALAVGIVLLASTSVRVAAGATLSLVRNGTSEYCIYCPAGAPQCVQQAAGELQRVIRTATGVTLAVQSEPAARMIAVGESAEARACGIEAARLPENGFVIRTSGERVFIVGRDLAAGQERWNFQVSRGTYVGACRFLEEVVGVRWLMPGDVGEDIPERTEILVPEMDRCVTPRFAGACLLSLWDDDPRVAAWRERYGLMRRLPVGGGHAFDDHPRDVSIFQEHPEFMALQPDGTRLPAPQGKPYAKYPTWKYCLTNPGLVTAFADSINSALDRDPKRLSAGMMPSDGPYWCVCGECQKLTFRADPQQWPSARPDFRYVTPAVLRFYNEVARRVGVRHPDRIVTGGVYQDYLYPPPEVVPLEPNIVLGIYLSSGYGFKFHKSERAREIQSLFQAWSRFTERLAYGDYSTWLRNWFGFPVPCGRPILKMLFPALDASKVQYVVYHGTSAWGYGGLHNYLVAHLLWNPKADVDALRAEYLLRAFGPAAEAMDRLDALLEEELKEFILAERDPDHEVDYKLVKAVWAPRWAEIEKLYAQAEAVVRTPAQRQRLEMFGDNLVLAHYNLRSAQLAAEPAKSRFYRSEQELKDFLAARKGTLSFYDWDTAAFVRRERPVLTPGWRPD